MTTLSRVTGKVFGGSAPLDEIGQFGSAKAGTKLNTQDVATIQALPAYSTGWGSAIMTSRNFPPIEEVTGVLKTISYQNCYLLQEGIPEYDSGTNYSNTSIVKSINGTGLKFFISLQNDNQGHALSDSTYWAEAILDSGRKLGEIVTSTIPLSDAGLHLLDGTLLSGSGIYADFVTYIAGIYNSSLNYFCTEAQWQASVSQYGVCGKFVYNSTNNTVRLPKVTGFIEGASGTSTLGNLTQAGLPNITGTYPTGSGATSSSFTGSFYWISDVSVPGEGGGGGEDDKGGFDASRSSSIYGNSTTVQPQSVKVLYYIVVATTTKTDIEVDIDEIATDLALKADVDLSNCTKPYVTATYVNGTSWWRLWSDKWCEQGGKATTTSSSVANMEVTFLKPYANNSYFVVQQHDSNNSTDMSTSTCAVTYVGITSKASTGFRTSSTTSFTGLASFYWYACGYIA